jgi:hypothetical protein
MNSLFSSLMHLSTILFIVIILLLVWLYVGAFFWISRWLDRAEQGIIDIFLQKIAKIPALIEVMRESVYDAKAFGPIISLHSESMIHEYDGIYLLLEHNARIQREFLFLMKLSVQIPELQKQEYFLYIRDFIISYERLMHDRFDLYNKQIDRWNRYIQIKNATMIGYLLPGSKKMRIH